jgi:hypothetical protein
MARDGVDDDDRTDLKSATPPRDVAAVLSRAEVLSAALVRVSPETLTGGASFELSSEFAMRLESAGAARIAGIDGVFMAYRTPQGALAAFHRTEGFIAGVVAARELHHEIMLLSPGRYASVELSQRLFPADHPGGSPSGWQGSWLEQIDWLEPCGEPPPDTPPAVVRALVAYTAAASAEHGPGIESAIGNAITLTNLSFRESGINVRIDAVVRETSWVESESDAESLVTLAQGQGAAASMHQLRDSVAADVVLVAAVVRDGCGLAAGIAPPADKAFAIFQARCGSTAYSLAHEFGHLLGARHDPDEDSERRPVQFQHGYFKRGDTSGFLTVMGVRSRDRPDRVLRWSNPRLTFLGGSAGSKLESDNACLLNRAAPVVARFRS